MRENPALLIGRFGCPECGHVPEEYRQVPLPGETREFNCSECSATFSIENRDQS